MFVEWGARKRSKSFLAAEAIAAYLESEEWQLGELQSGIAELDADQSISHEKVSKWLGWWGKRDETKAARDESRLVAPGDTAPCLTSRVHSEGFRADCGARGEAKSLRPSNSSKPNAENGSTRPSARYTELVMQRRSLHHPRYRVRREPTRTDCCLSLPAKMAGEAIRSRSSLIRKNL